MLCHHHYYVCFLSKKTAENSAGITHWRGSRSDGIITFYPYPIVSPPVLNQSAEFTNAISPQLAGLHGIVNNAGIVGNSGVDDWLTVDDYCQVVNVNTYGVIRVTHAFKEMVKRTKGRITTVASICARVPISGTGPYTVSKFAVSGYCDVLRLALSLFSSHFSHLFIFFINLCAISFSL